MKLLFPRHLNHNLEYLNQYLRILVLNQIVEVENINHSVDGELVLNKVSFTIENGDKVALTGGQSLSKTTLLQILSGEIKPDEGCVNWGETTTNTYFPKDNTDFFDTDENLIDWLQKFNENIERSDLTLVVITKMVHDFM